MRRVESEEVAAQVVIRQRGWSWSRQEGASGAGLPPRDWNGKAALTSLRTETEAGGQRAENPGAGRRGAKAWIGVGAPGQGRRERAQGAAGPRAEPGGGDGRRVAGSPQLWRRSGPA